MNITHILITNFITLISLATASGVILHDTHLDKAFSSATKVYASSDLSGDASSKARPGSNLHPHAEHLQVVKDRADNTRALPRERDRKRATPKRAVHGGFHGNNYCMPLAGEWA